MIFELKTRLILHLIRNPMETHKPKGFLLIIVTNDEKWVHYENPKERTSWKPRGQSPTSTANPNTDEKKSCFAFGEISFV